MRVRDFPDNSYGFHQRAKKERRWEIKEEQRQKVGHFSPWEFALIGQGKGAGSLSIAVQTGQKVLQIQGDK